MSEIDINFSYPYHFLYTEIIKLIFAMQAKVNSRSRKHSNDTKMLATKRLTALFHLLQKPFCNVRN